MHRRTYNRLLDAWRGAEFALLGGVLREAAEQVAARIRGPRKRAPATQNHCWRAPVEVRGCGWYALEVGLALHRGR